MNQRLTRPLHACRSPCRSPSLIESTFASIYTLYNTFCVLYPPSDAQSFMDIHAASTSASVAAVPEDELLQLQIEHPSRIHSAHGGVYADKGVGAAMPDEALEVRGRGDPQRLPEMPLFPPM